MKVIKEYHKVGWIAVALVCALKLVGAECEKAIGAAHFRIEGRGGNWQLISPDGKPTFMRAADHVKYDGFPCWKTGRNAYRDANDAQFPSRDSWATNTVDRLQRWGFNLLGCGSDDSLSAKGIYHAVTLDLVYPYCLNRGKDDERWLCENKHHPGSAFPNVFDPEYPAWCREQVREKAARLKDDPMLFGYFIDNELSWSGGRGKYGLFDVAFAKRPDHSARKAVEAFLAERGTSGARFGELPNSRKTELRRAFVRLVAQRFFEVTTDAIRAVDPDHLILGVRFAGLGAAPEILEECGRYCDVVTANCYPWVNLDQSRAFTSRGIHAEPVLDVLRRISETAKRPIMVTEWGFSALDSGLPCTKGAGQRFRTQAERTQAAQVFAREMLESPFIIGYSYFMWLDEPALGMHPAFLENTNYGLVNERGVPYPITEMFAALHADVEKIRGAMAAPAWTASSDGGGTLKDGDCAFTVRLGRRASLVEVAREGVPCANLSVQLKAETAGEICWPEVTNVKAVAVLGRSLEVTGEIRQSEIDVEVVVRCTPSAVGEDFRFELVRLTNRSQEPLTVLSILLKPYPAFKPQEPQCAPDLWDRWQQATWVAADGRTVDVRTSSPFNTFFTFQIFPDGSLHPDLMFAPRGGVLKLGPGESYDARGAVWINGQVRR